MFILIIVLACVFIYYISDYLQKFYERKAIKNDIIEAFLFYLFFFKLISIALIIGFILYYIAGVF